MSSTPPDQGNEYYNFVTAGRGWLNGLHRIELHGEPLLRADLALRVGRVPREGERSHTRSISTLVIGRQALGIVAALEETIDFTLPPRSPSEPDGRAPVLATFSIGDVKAALYTRAGSDEPLVGLRGRLFRLSHVWFDGQRFDEPSISDESDPSAEDVSAYDSF